MFSYFRFALRIFPEMIDMSSWDSLNISSSLETGMIICFFAIIFSDTLQSCNWRNRTERQYNNSGKDAADATSAYRNAGEWHALSNCTARYMPLLDSGNASTTSIIVQVNVTSLSSRSYFFAFMPFNFRKSIKQQMQHVGVFPAKTGDFTHPAFNQKL
jgi:hypothetical protein